MPGASIVLWFLLRHAGHVASAKEEIARLELREQTLDLERELLVDDSQDRGADAEINGTDGREFSYTSHA